MFTADTLIDTVSTAKKEFVKTFVKHEGIAQSMNDFVDAQTAYTKQAAQAGQDVATKMATEMTKAMQEAAKFDYATKLGETFGAFTKAFEVPKASKK
jgi:hypothetical protein